MKPSERREEIKSILIARREEKMEALALELNVSLRTIYRDIEYLIDDSFPLEKVRGNGGCVRLSDLYRPYRIALTKLESEILIGLRNRVTDYEWGIIERILMRHSAHYITQLILAKN